MAIDTGAGRIGPTHVNVRTPNRAPAARRLQRRTPTVSQAAQTPTQERAVTGRQRLARNPKLQRALRQVKHAQAALRHPAGLDPEQSSVLHTVLRQGQKAGANKTEKLSAVETGIVESNLRNLAGGDADSAGWRQERSSIYPDPTNVKHSAQRYFSEARSQRGQVHGAGELAANVQRPAEQYRGRYAQVEPEAKRVLRAATRPVKPPRKAVKKLQKAGVPIPRPKKGAAAPRSKPKPAIAELFYDPGTSIKEGQPTSSIGGHSDHVHIAADDPKSEKRFIKIAQEMGLHVGENKFVGDTPESGVHVSDSYHYRTMHLPSGKEISGAADITGTPEQMMAYDQRLAHKFGDNIPKGAATYTTGSGSTPYAGFSGPSTFAQATGISAKEAKQMTPRERTALAKQKLGKIHALFKGHDDPGTVDGEPRVTSKELEQRYGKAV